MQKIFIISPFIQIFFILQCTIIIYFLKIIFFIDVYHYYKLLIHIMILNLRNIQQINLNEYIYKLCFKFTFVQNFIFLLIFRKVLHFIQKSKFVLASYVLIKKNHISFKNSNFYYLIIKNLNYDLISKYVYRIKLFTLKLRQIYNKFNTKYIKLIINNYYDN